MLPDSAGLNPTTSVGTQPLAVVNLAETQPQTTMAVGVNANLSTTANQTVLVSTVVSTAPAYITPWRSPNFNLIPILVTT